MKSMSHPSLCQLLGTRQPDTQLLLVVLVMFNLTWQTLINSNIICPLSMSYAIYM